MVNEKSYDKLERIIAEYIDIVYLEKKALDEDDIDKISEIIEKRQNLIDDIEKIKNEMGEKQVQKILKESLAQCFLIQNENKKELAAKLDQTRKGLGDLSQKARKINSYKKMSEDAL